MAGPSSSTRAGASRGASGLAFTPSLVSRDGAHLRITEFPLDDRATGARQGGGNP